MFLSYDSMEEGEVDSPEEQQQEEEDVKLKESDQGVKEKNEIGDGDLGDTDVEMRSSSPPAVWAKKAF